MQAYFKTKGSIAFLTLVVERETHTHKFVKIFNLPTIIKFTYIMGGLSITWDIQWRVIEVCMAYLYFLS